MSLAFWRKRAPSRSRPSPVQPPAASAPIRITDERDGEILNRSYSYWSQAFVEASGSIVAFAQHADGRPRFFRLHQDGSIERLGALIGYDGGEGWYFTPSGEVMLTDGPRLRRVHPISGSDTVVLDISASQPGCRLWQAHSDNSGQVHSATVQRIVEDGAYPRVGTVVQKIGDQVFLGALGELDESHLTADGADLIIEESNDNRIIDLATWDERRITNTEGALSHIDCGSGYAVGEDDQRGACIYLDLRTLERRMLFETWAMGHVSVRAGRCLLSDSERLSLVALDGSGVTPLIAHGMTGAGYDHQVFANLDHTGTVAAYVSNAAGRNDLYLFRLRGE